jgi:hypothetical protein
MLHLGTPYKFNTLHTRRAEKMDGAPQIERRQYPSAAEERRLAILNHHYYETVWLLSVEFLSWNILRPIEKQQRNPRHTQTTKRPDLWRDEMVAVGFESTSFWTRA